VSNGTPRPPLERRKARARDVDDPIIDRILDLEHRLIAPQGETADLEIDAEFQLLRLA